MDDNSPLDYAAFIQELDELDRILADPDVQPVFYAELDEESTPMVDNNPVDFAEMIRDIDQLDRVLAQSDIRPMFDAQLDRVSMPMDDSCPLDYASVMQELDELDKIMGAIQNDNHTDNRDNTMADCDMRHTVDGHLDRVSKPTDDNTPLDFAAMMQDIDQLDEILAGIEYTNHIDTRDNAHCRVCSGQPCGSSDRCTCRTCTNCGVSSSGSICARCHSLPRCIACHRHLPPQCFPPDNPLCQACCNKQEKPHVRASERNIVTEVTIPSARATQSFEAFLNYNAGVINNLSLIHI